MAKYFLVFCLTLLCGSPALASTINLTIVGSTGSLISAENSQIGNSIGGGTLLLSPSDVGSDVMSFELNLSTQNTLMTFTNSELILQIAESIIVSGEVSNGVYSVASVQYTWDSCTTLQGSDYCESVVGIAGMSGTLTQVGEGFSLTTSADALLIGYSFTEPQSLDRQFELTQVPLPAALWLLVSALATVPTLRVFSSKRSFSLT